MFIVVHLVLPVEVPALLAELDDLRLFRLQVTQDVRRPLELLRVLLVVLAERTVERSVDYRMVTDILQLFILSMIVLELVLLSIRRGEEVLDLLSLLDVVLLRVDVVLCEDQVFFCDYCRNVLVERYLVHYAVIPRAMAVAGLLVGQTLELLLLDLLKAIEVVLLYVVLLVFGENDIG